MTSIIVWVLQDRETLKYIDTNWWLVDSIADAKLFAHKSETLGVAENTRAIKLKITMEDK